MSSLKIRFLIQHSAQRDQHEREGYEGLAARSLVKRDLSAAAAILEAQTAFRTRTLLRGQRARPSTTAGRHCRGERRATCRRRA